MPTLNINGFYIIIPEDKMFDVAIRNIDLKPTIEALKEATKVNIILEKPVEVKIKSVTVNPKLHLCGMDGCKKLFKRYKTKRTHQRKYHLINLLTQKEN